MKSKQIYNWSTNSKGNECLCKGPLPLYEIRPEGKHFRIMYYETCGVHTCNTIEEAREYINKKMEGYLL